MTGKFILATVAGLLTLAVQGQAGVIYSTFGENDSHAPMGYTISTSQWVAQPVYVSGTDWRVDSVEAAVFDKFTNPGGSITISIAADNTGEPGAFLESHTILPWIGGSIIEVPFTAGTILQQMGCYWLVLSSDDQGGGWSLTDPNQNGALFASQDEGVSWISFSNQQLSAARINATPVPEPFTLSLLALSGVAVIRRRRN